MSKLICGTCKRMMHKKVCRFNESIYRLEIFGHIVSDQVFDELMECPECGLIAYVVIKRDPEVTPSRPPA